MLSDWVAQDQPTASERLERFEQGSIEREKRRRKWAADAWRRARATLRTLPLEQRVALIREWNEKPYIPRTHEYFADFITQRVPGAKEEAHERIMAQVREQRSKRLAEAGYRPRR